MVQVRSRPRVVSEVRPPLALRNAHDRLEKLVAAIEDELADEMLTDEERLQHIGERLAQHRDDVEARAASDRTC